MFEKIDDWLDTISISTQKYYGPALKDLENYLHGREFKIEDYRGFMETFGKTSYENQRHKATAANSYFRFIGKRPLFLLTAKPLRNISSGEVDWTLEQIKTSTSKNAKRDYTIIYLQSVLGLNTETLLNLTYDDVLSYDVVAKDATLQDFLTANKGMLPLKEHLKVGAATGVMRRNGYTDRELRALAVKNAMNKGYSLDTIVEMFNIEHPDIIWRFL